MSLEVAPPPAVPLLAAPRRPTWARLVNVTGRGLDRLGARPWRLVPQRLMDRAQRQARLSDFGEQIDGFDFRAPLGRLCQSLEEEAELTLLGRYVVREELTRLLVNRLIFQDIWTRHPEALDVPVPSPLIVAGLPRSGTTKLHRLLSLEGSGRPLLFWETLWPTPPPTPETHHQDPRAKRARRLVRTMDGLAPDLLAGHEITPDGPEECNGLFNHTFQHPIFSFMYRIPSYMDWLLQSDMTGPYRYYRRLLQLLSWKFPTGRWVLKAPAHTFFLDTLLSVFPDACVVLLHRDPRQVVPSVARLSVAFRRISSDFVDPGAIGVAFNESLAWAFERSLGVLAERGTARILPVAYKDLMADSLATVHRIHDHFGIARDSGLDERVRSWLTSNPQHKHGRHEYSLEQFGLDPAAVDARWAFYHDWLARP